MLNRYTCIIFSMFITWSVLLYSSSLLFSTSIFVFVSALHFQSLGVLYWFRFVVQFSLAHFMWKNANTIDSPCHSLTRYRVSKANAGQCMIIYLANQSLANAKSTLVQSASFSHLSYIHNFPFMPDNSIKKRNTLRRIKKKKNMKKTTTITTNFMMHLINTMRDVRCEWEANTWASQTTFHSFWYHIIGMDWLHGLHVWLAFDK